MVRRSHITAHELGQFAYWAEAAPDRRVPREEDFQRGLQVHARLEAAHTGRRVAAKRTLPWDWVAVGAFLLLVLGVALWTH